MPQITNELNCLKTKINKCSTNLRYLSAFKALIMNSALSKKIYHISDIIYFFLSFVNTSS